VVRRRRPIDVAYVIIGAALITAVIIAALAIGWPR
jgi:hypothetical protein